MRNVLMFLSLVGLITLEIGCTDMSENKRQTLNLHDLDQTANPGDDFDQYANGGWKASNAIPEDKSRFGSFDLLMDRNEIMIQKLIDGIISESHAKGSVNQKISDFINTGMDSSAIEDQGVKPLVSEFEQINSINSVKDVEDQLIHFHGMGIPSAFGLYAGADAKNSAMTIAILYQSGLGLPDRDYYLTDNERFNDIREKYILHVERMFSLLGDSKSEAQANAAIVFEMEKQFATASMDRMSLRDPHKTYNINDLSSLAKLSPNFDWVKYFESTGVNDPGQLNIGQPEFISSFDAMFTNESVHNWKTYFRWNLINSTANFLSSEFVDADFDFYGKTMSGTPENKPRWKRVLAYANSYLGEAIGQAYVKEYFPPEAKERMLALVENLKVGLGERIEQLDWMGDETKKNAQEKLNAVNVKIAYPDKWKDYSLLEVENDVYVLNILRAKKFAVKERFAKINKPVDKEEWHMPPQVVNAYYSPSKNEIVFPAGILQPPFFYLNGDDAMNYGAIGVVIGHEMTHGFDDKGRLYDKDGNLNTWWTDEDSERFTKKTDVLVNQFNDYTVLDSLKANGKYTLGENIADLGGVNISYKAFTKTEQWKNQATKLDGYSPDQRFFLSYAHLWAQNIRDKEILRRTQEDVHSLGRLRVIGPLRNVPQFHVAFNIQESDYMFIPEEEQANIW